MTTPNTLPQRPRTSAFIATSLDGFIARNDGRIDWLEHANAEVPQGEDCGYGAFFASIDVVVMGRKTFELVATFSPWPYAGKQVVVLSRGALAIPEPLAAHGVSSSSEAPEALLRRLGTRGASHVYIDGGVTIARFIHAGLLDDITITSIPVLLGEGRPLFGDLDRDHYVELIESRAFPFGFVQSRYRLAGRAPE